MKTKTILFGFAALLVLLALAVAPVAAKADPTFGTLVAKDGSSWAILDNGMSGKMMYKMNPVHMFVFNAKGMKVGTEYALINYINYAHANPILGTGVADTYGEVHIAGEMQELQLDQSKSPALYKSVFLVPTSDLNADGSFANVWNPAEYLFEAVSF
jgi:hypothetical protein